MGGLQIVDLKKKSQAIKMSWIARLFDENCPGKFKHTMIEILNQCKQANLGKSVLKTFLNPHFIRQLPNYYNKLLTAWANFLQDKRSRPSNIGQILTEPLFYYRFLTTGNLGEKHLIFFPGWCKNGVREVSFFIGRGHWKFFKFCEFLVIPLLYE